MRRRSAERQFGARPRLFRRQSSNRSYGADYALARSARSRGALTSSEARTMAIGSSILVTGGAGYLGSILVPELLAAGHRVTVLDNFMYLQNTLSANCANPNFDVVNGDTRSADILKPLVAKADYVFPLAALVGAPLCKKDPI